MYSASILYLAGCLSLSVCVYTCQSLLLTASYCVFIFLCVCLCVCRNLKAVVIDSPAVAQCQLVREVNTVKLPASVILTDRSATSREGRKVSQCSAQSHAVSHTDDNGFYVWAVFCLFWILHMVYTVIYPNPGILHILNNRLSCWMRTVKGIPCNKNQTNRKYPQKKYIFWAWSLSSNAIPLNSNVPTLLCLGFLPLTWICLVEF